MTKKRALPKASSRRAKMVTIGRARFAKISAVEGIALTPAMQKRAAEFERTGLSAKERRDTIIRTYRRS
jgi:hypothetical protein